MLCTSGNVDDLEHRRGLNEPEKGREVCMYTGHIMTSGESCENDRKDGGPEQRLYDVVREQVHRLRCSRADMMLCAPIGVVSIRGF